MTLEKKEEELQDFIGNHISAVAAKNMYRAFVEETEEIEDEDQIEMTFFSTSICLPYPMVKVLRELREAAPLMCTEICSRIFASGIKTEVLDPVDPNEVNKAQVKLNQIQRILKRKGGKAA